MTCDRVVFMLSHHFSLPFKFPRDLPPRISGCLPPRSDDDDDVDDDNDDDDDDDDDDE